MIKKLRSLILILGIALGVGLMVPVSVGAVSVIADQCAADPTATVCKQEASKNSDPKVLTKNIINTLLFVIGAISVIVIIVGGIMYATSAGDTGQVTKAKNTITGAVIGLVVAFLAFAIVQFVVSNIK